MYNTVGRVAYSHTDAEIMEGLCEERDSDEFNAADQFQHEFWDWMRDRRKISKLRVAGRPSMHHVQWHLPTITASKRKKASHSVGGDKFKQYKLKKQLPSEPKPKEETFTAWRLLISNQVYKMMNAFPATEKARISSAIAALTDNPRPRDAATLNEDRRLTRIRVGNYRVIYRIDTNNREIEIVNIAHRKEAYGRGVGGIRPLSNKLNKKTLPSGKSLH